MATGKLWVQQDRFGNEIYLTEERWQHIVDPDNHPEVATRFDLIRETLDLDGDDKNRLTRKLGNTIAHLMVCPTITRM